MRRLGFVAIALLFATCASLADAPVLSLRLTAIGHSFRAGATISVKVTTVNESSETVTYHDTNPYCNYSFTVLTSAGAPAPETTFKKQLKCNGSFLITGRDIVRTLKPGERKVEDVRLTELYNLSRPDDYSVQVDRTFPGIGHFSSNAINIAVTP